MRNAGFLSEDYEGSNRNRIDKARENCSMMEVSYFQTLSRIASVARAIISIFCEGCKTTFQTLKYSKMARSLYYNSPGGTIG